MEAQVRADFELAQMLSLSMDDDEESWVLQETRRREHRRTGGAEVRWGEEHASRVGLGPSADETVMRHAERAARRALKRIQQQTGRDASAPLRETTQRHVTRQAVAEAFAQGPLEARGKGGPDHRRSHGGPWVIRFEFVARTVSVGGRR